MSSEKHDKSTTDGLLAAWRAAALEAVKEKQPATQKPTNDPLVQKWRAASPVTLDEKAKTLEEKLARLQELDPRTADLVRKALDAEPTEEAKQAEDEAW